MKKISITIIVAILMCTIPFSACGFIQESPTEESVESTAAPTETMPAAEPTPTKVPLGKVITLELPATYAALYDGIKVYSDATRSTVLTILVKGDQVMITGTCDGYGVTAEGTYINLILMTAVVITTPTPTPTAAPTEAPVETTAPTTSPSEPTAIPTPKATPTPKPTPTPKVTAVPTTPVPTTAPVATLSAAEVESLVWTQVEAARSGFTTNHSDVLSTRCRKSAERFVISHSIPNGSCESCGNIVQQSSGKWAVYLHNEGQVNYSTLEEAVRALGEDLVTVHVPLMASTAEYTEFGVGVARMEPTAAYPRTEYYVYISCASPSSLQYQIDTGWYD